MSAHFKLVREGSELSGNALRKDRDLIARQLLKVIENYGSVVRRADKSKLIEQVEHLRKAIESFKQKLENSLQKSIDKGREELVKALLPAVQRKPPKSWRFSDGRKPDKAACRTFIEQ